MRHIVEYKRTEIVHLEIVLPDDLKDAGEIAQDWARGVVARGAAPQGYEFKRIISDWERCHYERRER